MPTDVAIVAAAFTLPGGIRDLDTLHATLRAGRPQVGPLPAGLRHRSWSAPPLAGWVPGFEDFDPGPFGLSIAEATLLDPRHRLLLHHAREALHAARALDDPETVGVFLGLGGSEYRDLCPPGDPRVATGTESSTAAGRIAHSFGLGGPALVIDTACSSFLVALHQARRALQLGDCTVALVGAAQLIGSPAGWERLERTGILSPTSTCRPLDADADGTVRGEGGGVIVLRLLSDAEARGDSVLGVVTGTAVGHDGAAAGLTVPHGPAQERLLRMALADAGIGPDDIGLLEGHLTGTSLGDPIEVQALRQVFGPRAVPLTAAKAVFGHLEAAAGLVGLLAALAALRTREVPPVANLITASPRLPADGPRAVASPQALDGPLRAGISAFGLSGTNAHAILEPRPGDVPIAADLPWAPQPLWVQGQATAGGVAQEADTALGDVRGAVAAVLGGDADRLPAQRSLFELGLDSVAAAELARRLDVPVATIFEHPTIASLEARTPRPATAPRSPVRQTGGPIAIVAAACRFPGGVVDLATYHDLLVSDRDVVGPAPADRGLEGVGGFLDDVFGFDPAAFGLSPREVEVMDPQQRLWVEVAAEVLDRGGVADDLRGRTGLFVGAAESQYLRDWREPDVGVGNEGSFVAGRSAHVLGLGGPVMMLNTACSASLVAVHVACRSLADGECDAAIAGGVSLLLSSAAMQMLGSLGVLSPTGRCHTFSDDADGYVRGEGAAAVLLMRLDDAVERGHEVLAIVRGSAVAHDGRTGGVAVPGARAWRQVVADALARSGVSGSDIGYIEAHGSATPLGDAIEAKTLGEALSAAGRSGPVWAGSAKSRLGHLEQAAGMAGLLKVLVMLQHGVRVPNLHFHKPSPQLPPGVIRVPTEVQPWDGPRIAGISAFGISGTAAHVIVAAPPLQEPRRASLDAHWLALSASGEPALAGLGTQMAAALARGLAPADAARSLAARPAGPVRAAVVASAADLPAALADVVAVTARAPRFAWVFPGAGPQRPAMGAHLEGLPAWLDAHEPAVEPILGPGLRAVLLDHDDRIRDIAWTVVATVALELFLAEGWMARGLRPVAVAGHSFGEIAAACVAGVLRSDDALRLAALRGVRMREVPVGGTMVVVRTDEATARAAIGDAPVDVAAANGPAETVLSGPRDALEAVVQSLGVDDHWLEVDRAWHSAAVQPVVAGFVADLAGLPLSAPEIPLITGRDGQPAGARSTDPAHWGALLRHTVQWGACAQGLADAGCDAFLEVGPHPALLASVGSTLGTPPEGLIGTLHRDLAPGHALLEAAARLWALGAPLDPAAVIVGGRIVNDVPVPPLDRQSFRVAGAGRTPEPAVPSYRLTWEPADVGEGPSQGRWAVLGASPLAGELAQALAARGVTVVREPTDDLDGVVVAPSLEAASGESVIAAVTEAVHALQAVPPGTQVVLASRGEPGALQGVARALSWERPRVGAVAFDADTSARVNGLGQPEIAWRSGVPHAPRFVQRAPPTPPAHVSGTWVVIGGFGVLGRGIAEALHASGADRVVVAGPRVRPVPAPLLARELAAEDAAGLRALLAELGPVEGVVLAAGVLDDARVEQLTDAQIRRVLAPKALGITALQAAADDVPYWLLMGSASGWVGSAGQVPYSAANAVLDAAAVARRARGKHACSVALGPVAGAGMAARQGVGLQQQHALLGIRSLSVAAAIDALRSGLAADAPALLGAFDVDWSKLPHRAAVTAAPGLRSPSPTGARATAPPAAPPPAVPDDVEGVIEALARRYLRKPIPDRRTDLAELGLDSLGAVGLRNALADNGIELPVATLLRGPSIADLAAEVRPRGHVALAEAPVGTLAAAPTEPVASLPELAVALSVLSLVAAVALLLAQS